jgi:uncharacterized membrane protein YraQ (UPF0718 family)
MKLTLLSLLFLLVGVMGAALWRGMDTFKLGLRTSGTQLAKFLPILLVAILLAGFAEVLLPKQLIETWLSDASGWRGILIAWIAGALTPGGSVMGFPFVAALYQAGAGIGVLITYLTSLALLSLMRIPLEIGFYGGRIMALRLVTALLLPPIAGMLARGVAPLFLER